MTPRQLIPEFLPALSLMNEVPSTLDLGSRFFSELANNDWQLSIGGRISRHAVGSSGLADIRSISRMCQHSVRTRFVELSQRVIVEMCRDCLDLLGLLTAS